MSKLTLKKILSELSFNDAAGLVFANHLAKYKSDDQIGLLTSSEERFLILKCKQNNHIDHLNKLVRIFNALQDIVNLLPYVKLKLELVICKIQTALLLINSKEKSSIYDKSWNLFVSTHKSSEAQPNLYLQKLFMSAVRATREIKQVLLILDQLLNEAGNVSLLSNSDQQRIDSARSYSNYLLNHEGIISTLDVFRHAREQKKIISEGYTEEGFEQLLIDPQTAIKLTDTDIQDAKRSFDRLF